MNKTVAGVFVACFLFLSFPSLLKATSVPLLSSPSDNITITSAPTFTWQTVPEAIQYRIIVDDEPTVTGTSIKDYYTTNTYYSPQLIPGTYYWKVKAKDVGNVWSDWSCAGKHRDER